MNKLILIGNGFDLAHRINTSYNHFIEAYFKNIYGKSLNPNKYSDSLIEVLSPFPNSLVNPVEASKSTYSDFFYHDNVNFDIKSDFFRSLLETRKLENWVDIEDLLFNEIFNLINFEKKQIDIKRIKKLNHDFEYLKKKLIEYLKEITIDLKVVADQRYLDKFLSGIKNLNKDSITFLNFNYTNTINVYIDKCHEFFEKQVDSEILSSRIKRINIHGNLYEENNLPIFGIGDEHHDKYKAIKEFKDIYSILRNSKSFWYQRNNNYKDLMRVLNAKPNCKVEIYGHACGLSDRTLLKNIFEHKSVYTIELFHFGGLDGYVKQSYDIWRHFDDSQAYRTKLVSYKEENEMPQITEVIK